MSNQQPTQLQSAPPERSTGGQQFLLVRAGACVCAIPLASVIETMRPLPIQAMRDLPPYVEGVSVIRGESIPVLRLGALLCEGELPPAQRFVVLRLDHRRVALAVEAVLGMFRLDAITTQEVPPLLRDVQPELIAGIAGLDRELVLILRSSHILPAEAWAALESRQQSL